MAIQPPSKPTIIALSGYAGSGKDEVFRLIQKHIPEARRYAFADALKEKIARKCHVDIDDINQDKSSYRKLLQEWGQGKRRDNPDYWVNKVAERVADDKPKLAVITDCRYPNEAQWARSCGGILVRVHRPFVGPLNGHESETALDETPSNYCITNYGDLEELETKVVELLTNFGHLTAQEKYD